VNANVLFTESSLRLFKYLANTFFNTMRQAFIFRSTNAVPIRILESQKTFCKAFTQMA